MNYMFYLICSWKLSSRSLSASSNTNILMLSVVIMLVSINCFILPLKDQIHHLKSIKFLITFLLSLNKTSWKVSYTFIYICIKQIKYVHVLPISNISISAMGNTQSCIRSKSLNNSEIHPLNIINSIQNIVINCIY